MSSTLKTKCLIFTLEMSTPSNLENKKLRQFELGGNIRFEDFFSVIRGESVVSLGSRSTERLRKTRSFVDYLLTQKMKVYGCTTGFADLREVSIDPEESSMLSHNILQSHDASIGEPLNFEVVLGAMLIRAHTLSRGFSGFRVENLHILIELINKRIVPLVGKHGSIGASDIPWLAKLGRLMEGEDGEMLVYYKNGKNIVKYGEVRKVEKISSAKFFAKEGLAISSGTSFSLSLSILAYSRLCENIENMFGVLGLTMNSSGVVDASYLRPVHKISNEQKGQYFVSKILHRHLDKSMFADRLGTQDDICLRCLPQIFGYLTEQLIQCGENILREVNSVHDNPLIFCGEETKGVNDSRIINFEGEKWSILSTGNFQSEYLSQICDNLSRAIVKPVLTLERHLTYLMNPSRGSSMKKRLLGPAPYLIDVRSSKVGLMSGCMILQYTANSIVQKISRNGNPVSIFNITSGNECEDILSYSATSAQNLLEQTELLEDFLVVYTLVAVQAYSIALRNITKKEVGEENDEKYRVDPENLSQRIFSELTENIKSESFPIHKDRPFQKLYGEVRKVIRSGRIREIMGVSLRYKELNK